MTVGLGSFTPTPEPPKRNPRNMGDVLRATGFDSCELIGRGRGSYYEVGCSQCAAIVINGTPCHEERCPNQRRRR